MKEKRQPYPQAALRFLAVFCPDHLYEELSGDLIQKFNRDAVRYGIPSARRRFIWNTVRFFRPAILFRNKISTQPNQLAMLGNFIKTGLRFNRKEKFYSILNMLGLTVGLVSVMILAAFAYNELSYDKFHTDYKKIYRVSTHYTYSDKETGYAINRGFLDALLDDAEGITSSAAMMAVQSNLIFEADKKLISDSKGYYADEDFFSVFDFNMLAGVPANCLKEPNAIVITQNLAEKLFGSIDVLGRTIQMKNEGSATELLITGVVEQIPLNSHLNFNFIISGTTLTGFWKNAFSATQDGSMPFYTYFKTTEALSTAEVQKKADGIFKPAFEKEAAFRVQPLEEVYFNAKTQFEPTTGGNLQYVKIFIWVGIALLVITIVNFINISTSHSLKRIKEIGVRKSLGTTRSSLITQFLTESVLITLLTTVLSYAIAFFILQGLSVSFYPLELSIAVNPITLLILAGFGVLLGLLAGIFPSLKITTIHTTSALKGKITLGKEAIYSPRNALVLIQLIFTISLVSFLLLMHRQVDFLNARLHTADKEKVLYFNRPQTASDSQWQGFQERISTQSSITAVGTSWYPLIENDLGRMNMAGIWIDKNPKNSVTTATNYVSIDFIETLGLTMAEGRSFSKDYLSDSSAIIINEAAQKALDLKEAVGADVTWWRGKFKVIGVVRDFHFQSFNNKITPVIFVMDPYSMVLFARTNNPKQALASIEKTWKEAKIDAPFDVRFMDDSFEKMLEKETRLSGIIVAFTFIALIVMGIGTLGLIGYIVNQKQKEIGIRKVYGASVISVLRYLNFRFVVLLMLALICSALLVHKISQQWLATFEYKVNFSMLDYVLGAAAVSFFSFIIIEAQAIRAALVNPVKTLRHE